MNYFSHSVWGMGWGGERFQNLILQIFNACLTLAEGEMECYYTLDKTGGFIPPVSGGGGGGKIHCS